MIIWAFSYWEDFISNKENTNWQDKIIRELTN